MSAPLPRVRFDPVHGNAHCPQVISRSLDREALLRHANADGGLVTPPKSTPFIELLKVWSEFPRRSLLIQGATNELDTMPLSGKTHIATSGDP